MTSPAEQERAAVVAYIREMAVITSRDTLGASTEDANAANTAVLTMMNIAVLIEAGEHLRGGE